MQTTLKTTPHDATPIVGLAHWPLHTKSTLERLIRTHQHQTPKAYAVFDADNTLWQHDLTEALLAHLESQAVLTPGTLDPSLVITPFLPDESLFAYYSRLCTVDIDMGYPWIAQSFAGLSLLQLKHHVDVMMQGGPIATNSYVDGKLQDIVIHPPKPYQRQLELVHALEHHGIDVFVITAAAEEIARMVLCDARYGVRLAPSRVIGISVWLKHPSDASLTTTRQQIGKAMFRDVDYPSERHLQHQLTTMISPPAPYRVGKLAAMRAYIDAVRQPVLVAGDSPSDHWMLFETDVATDGVRLWVEHSEAYREATKAAQHRHALAETRAGRQASAHHGWLTVTPAELS